MKQYSTRVLYYHVIADQLPDLYPQGIGIRRFLYQLSVFKALGWRFASLSEALVSNHPKQLCITLDDGLAANYPILMQLNEMYGVKPTLFLIGRCVDNRALAWNHKLILLRRYVPRDLLNHQINLLIPGADHITLFSRVNMQDKDLIVDRLWSKLIPWSEHEYLEKNKPFFSVEQLKSLANKGIRLALHSHSHPDFSRLSKAETKAEIEQNIETLTSYKLPWENHFAYPYGRVGSNPESLAQEMKIDASFGTYYKAGNNLAGQAHWQRQCMELSARQNFREFVMMPGLRKFFR